MKRLVIITAAVAITAAAGHLARGALSCDHLASDQARQTAPKFGPSVPNQAGQDSEQEAARNTINGLFTVANTKNNAAMAKPFAL